MNKNSLALSVFRTIKAANDDDSSAATVSPNLAKLPLLFWQNGWDPFEIWRTRIRVAIARGPQGKR